MSKIPQHDVGGPADHMSTRMPRFGSEAHDKGDSRKHGLQEPGIPENVVCRIVFILFSEGMGL